MASTVIAFLPVAGGTASAATVNAAANPTGGNYVPLTPTRLADTRCGENPAVGGSNCTTENIPTANAALKTVPAGGTIVVTASGVPAGAAAASLSVTAVDGTAPGFLTVFPDGTSLPLESSVNYVAGTPACTTIDCIAPNLTITPLSSTDKFDVYNGGSGSVDVVVDLEGYFNAPSATTGGAGHYFPLSPSRLADTRCGDTPPGAGSNCSAENIPTSNAALKTVGPSSTINVSVLGIGGVPLSGVSAVVVELTVANTTATSFMTAFPSGGLPPTTSVANWVPGQITANRAIVPVGTNGQIALFNFAGNTDMVVDVVGYFSDSTAAAGAGSLFNPIAPVRLGDTRVPSPAPLVAGQSGTLQISGANGIPSGATSAALNVTEASATASGFLTVTPNLVSPPVTTSDVDFTGGEIRANADLATLSTGGSINIYNFFGSTNVVVDAFGYFVAATPTGSNNQTITVSPSGPQHVAIGSQTVETVTTSGTGPYDIQLFSCNNVVPGSPTTFAMSTNPGGTGNFATQGNISGTADITAVNGAAVSPASVVNGQTSVTSFAFTDGASECVVPVVFVQGAAGVTQNLLPLGTTNAPTVPFGVGVTESFTPAGAPIGSFGGGLATAPSVVVTQEGTGFFVGGGATYSFQSTDSYSLWNSTTSVCAADSFTDFEARLSLNDTVGGLYNPTGTSSFCLDDSAPAVASVVAAKAATSAGVTLTITQSIATDATNQIVGYQIYRATATPPSTTGAPYTCPVSSPLPVNASPQTPPTGTYSSIGKVNTSNTGVETFTDTGVSAGSSTSTPNAYCYAVSSIALAAISGTTQTGTAAPATANNPPPSTSGTPGATTPAPEVPANGVASATPAFTTADAAGGTTVIVQYNQALNPSSVDNNGSQYVVTYVPSGGGPTFADGVTAATQTSPNVTLTVAAAIPNGATVTVTAQNGSTPSLTTVCSATSASNCELVGDAVQITASASASVVPKLAAVAATASGMAIGLVFNQPVSCATLTTSDYVVQSPIATVIAPTSVSCAGATASAALLNFAAGVLVVGQQFSVTATGQGPANTLGLVEPSTDFMSGTVST